MPLSTTNIRIVSVSIPYRFRIVSVSFPYRFRIDPVSFPYRFRIVSVSFPYRFRIVSVSIPYRFRIVLLSSSYHPPIAKRKTIRNRTNDERMRIGGTRVVNFTIIVNSYDNGKTQTNYCGCQHVIYRRQNPINSCRICLGF